MSPDAEDRGPPPFFLWWVEEYGRPPLDTREGVSMVHCKQGWDGAVAYLLPQVQEAEAEVERLLAELVAASEGYPVNCCPNCGAPAVDYDGTGLLSCPRDRACYCTCPSSDNGVCLFCGKVLG